MIPKKIFEGVMDEEVHSDFLRFSRGEFKDKYLVDAKKQAKKWAVKTGPEYANSFVRSGLSACSDDVKVKGIISTTLDLADEIPFEISKISNFQGVKKYVINTTLNPSDVISLIDKYPRVFFALSFNNGLADIKIKAKPPKSGKPGKGDEAAKADFCTIKSSEKSVVEDLFFDVGFDWKEISVNHTIVIDGIVYPENVTELKPAEVREQAKRKGKLLRRVIMDGKESKSEAPFTA